MYTYERIARTDVYRRVLPFINWLNRIKKCRVLTICICNSCIMPCYTQPWRHVHTERAESSTCKALSLLAIYVRQYLLLVENHEKPTQDRAYDNEQ